MSLGTRLEATNISAHVWSLLTSMQIRNKATVFRVRGAFSRSDLPGVLKFCLGTAYNPCIKSFAPQADENVNIATVTFNTTPIQLSGSDQITFEEQNVTFDTHFRGLSVLFSPEAAHHHLDIIAICGLGAHAFGSFKERNGTHMWLRDSLPHDFKNARVFVYGYDSKIYDSNSFQTLESLATSLRNLVEGIKPLSRSLHETPTVFIAHSLGGLVLKQALIQSVKAKSKIAHCTRGALFFGVPNQGMHVSSLIAMAANQPNEALLHNLQQESELLRSQSRDFAKYFVSRKARIFCFYETKTSPTAVKEPDGTWRMTGEHVLFVGSASATHCRPWESEAHHVLGLNREHSGLVKFTPGDEDYIKVRNVLREIVNDQYRLSRPKPMISEAEQKLTDQCLKAMGHTNPIDTMRRIESTKDDLVAECNEWIKRDPHLEEWKNNPYHRLLWLSGDPGKGKTMLMMSLIQEFQKPKDERHILTFFFCQNTDSRLNTAHAVLCGLLWLLVRENPVLGCYLHEDYRHQKEFLSGPDAFVALCRIMTEMLQDVALPPVYILIDALDECDEGRSELLKFIGQNATSAHSKAKWLVSSRNHLDIERGFKMRQHDVLSLELNTTKIAAAVEYFIRRKVDNLAKRNNYGDKLRERVQKHLVDNAQSTFLWVALACKHLNDTAKRNISAELVKLPVGLSSLYDRMLDQLREGQDRALTLTIIKFVTIAKRPLSTEELLPLIAQEILVHSEEPTEDLLDNGDLLDLIKSCGSFITVRNGTIYLIHQSAKDYLVFQEGAKIFSPNMKDEHCLFIDHSLAMMSNELMKDIHSPSYPRQAIRNRLQILKSFDYSARYWIDHLVEYQSSCGVDGNADLARHGNKVYEFVLNYFLRWTESLCLLGQLKAVPGLLGHLEAAAKRYDSEELHSLTHDATRFLTHSYLAIEQDPFQIYNFGLTFAPEESLIRRAFLDQASTSIAITSQAGSKKWSQLQQTFDGHEAMVWSVTFSPDGQKLASASHDRTVRLWDTVTGELSRTLQGHTRGIYSVTFSPDGRQLATASQDTTVKLWDTLSGDLLWTLRGHTKRVLETAFSPDGKTLASRSDDFTPRLWNTATGMLVRKFDGHTGPVWALHFSQDGKSLVTGSKDDTIRIWKIETEEPSSVLYRHKSPVYLEMLSSHAQQIASASMSGRPTIGLWDNSSHKQLWLNGHTAWVRKLTFSSDNQQLASSADDFAVRVWDTKTGECLKTFEGHSKHPTPIAFSPDGQRLAFSSAFSSEDGVVQLRDVKSGELLQTLSKDNACLNDRIKFLVFSPDGRQLATGSDQYFIQLWDVANSRQCRVVERCTDKISSITFGPSGRKVITGSEDGMIRIWDATTGESLQTLKGHTRPVRSTVFSLDETLTASASSDHLLLWDVETNKTVRTYNSYVRNLNQAIVSPTFRKLASTSRYGHRIFLWSIATGKILRKLEGHTGLISSLAFGSNGRYLASNSHDGTVRVWDTIVGRPLQTLQGIKGTSSTLAFGSNDLKLASASKDEILLWDTSTWNVIRKISCAGEWKNASYAFRPLVELDFDHSLSWLWEFVGDPFSLRFSRNGHQLTLARFDGTDKKQGGVQVWDCLTGQVTEAHRIAVVKDQQRVYSPDGRLYALISSHTLVSLADAGTGTTLTTFHSTGKPIGVLVFDPQGHHVAAATSTDYMVYLWSMETGKVAIELKGHKSEVNLLSFSRNGQQLLSGSVTDVDDRFRSMWLWDLKTGKALWQTDGHWLPVRSMAFSPDKRQLASASDDTAVRLWDVSTGQLLQRLEGHTDQVHSVAFSPDGQKLASGSKDRTVRLWDTSTGTSLRKLEHPIDSIESVEFSPDGRQVVTQFRYAVMHGKDQSGIGLQFDTRTNWLRFNGDQLIWLPREFRPEVSAVCGNSIAIGCASGAVYFLGVDVDRLQPDFGWTRERKDRNVYYSLYPYGDVPPPPRKHREKAKVKDGKKKLRRIREKCPPQPVTEENWSCEASMGSTR